MVDVDFHNWLTHPCADEFPTMDEADFRKLKEDIRLNGVLEPVSVASIGGKTHLVDGRHRREAVLALEDEGETIALPYRELKDFNPSQVVSYVMSLNVHRRHLTPSMRAAMSVNLYEKLQNGEVTPQSLGVKPGLTREVAGAAMGVNTSYVQEAKNIKETHPDLFEQLQQGTLSIKAAQREIADRLEAQSEERISGNEVVSLEDAEGEDVPSFQVMVLTCERDYPRGQTELEIVARLYPVTPQREVATVPPYHHLFAILQGDGSGEGDAVQNGWTLAAVWFKHPPSRFMSNVSPTMETFLRTIAVKGERALVKDLPIRYAEILADAGMSAYHYEKTV